VSERRQRRRTDTRGRGGFIAGNIVGLATTTAVAAATLWPVYESFHFVVLVAGTFAIGAAVALAGSRLAWPPWALILATVAVYFIAGVPLAIPDLAVGGVLPSAGGLHELLAATALSWKQLVTIVLPVGTYQSLLVPPFIMVLLSTVVGLSVALRARHAELGVLAPIGLFVSGIALGPSIASAPIERGLTLFVALLFWLLWLGWYRRRRAVRVVPQPLRGATESASARRLGSARGLVSATAIVAIAIAAGTATAIASPASAPRDVVRAHVQQPFDPRDYPSPLSGFRSYLQPERASQALLQVTGLPAGGRVRLAALDAYDGVVYSVGSDTVSSASGSFTRLPYRLDQSTVAGTEVTLDVTVGHYSGVWVPGAGQLESIAFHGGTAPARSDSFFYNDNSGTGAVLGGLHAGDSYRSKSVVPQPVEDISALRPGTAALPPIGVVPEGVAEAIAGYVVPGDSPGVALQSVLRGLKADGYVSHGVGAQEPTSRSGHGADRITQLFTDRPMLGDAEQYAVAAALLARQIGFPARVVVGFTPAGTGGASPVTVTGSDASAWIEVQASDGSWVTIDPNPAERQVPDKQPDEPTIVSRPQSVVPPPVKEDTERRDLTPRQNTQQDAPPPVDPLAAILLAALAVAGWVLLGLALAALPFVAIVVAKARRRRLRTRSPSALERIRGGWREFADTAVDFGIEVPPMVTRTELAEAVGEPRSLLLASVVDRAVFSPGQPSADEADEVWRAVAELRALLAGARTRGQRLKALISLRSFGRYAGGAARRGAVT
jgi:hypothetical protein